jgi:hypothetical protein
MDQRPVTTDTDSLAEEQIAALVRRLVGDVKVWLALLPRERIKVINGKEVRIIIR